MIKIKRNCKEIERRMLESKGAQKQGESMVYEISQPKVGRCENRLPLRNNFAALKSRCENPPPSTLAAKIAFRYEMVS